MEFKELLPLEVYLCTLGELALIDFSRAFAALMRSVRSVPNSQPSTVDSVRVSAVSLFSTPFGILLRV